MKTWTINKFLGHWPVGTAAVVVAATPTEAARYLERRLSNMGLKQHIDPNDFQELPLEDGVVEVLNDGNY